jgi:radical SAM superfamily enzyme YgiQ (UPF0313 family)
MRLCLVGADFEENLGIGMIAAAAEDAGHAPSIVAFNHVGQTAAVVQTVMQQAPDVVGLSIQFQHRVYEFLALARKLRAAGFRGHITCGGQFPSLAWKDTLDPRHGVDSVTLHEGERTIVDLLDAVAQGRKLGDVPGLAVRTDDGVPMRTCGRELVKNLDDLPVPKRYRGHSKHVGIPFIPIMGSRGCWETCAYCSIVAFYKDAKSYGGGKLFRYRTPQHVADEIAVLWHRAGGTGVFCFHDDNFLLPSRAASLARVKEMRAALDQLGVSRLGIVGKSRPDCIDLELAKELRALGVVRLYVGVENASESGAVHLMRGTPAREAQRALTACRQAGIFVCYNLLIFEPDSRTDHIHENIAFIRRHPHYPVNFCRAEPYFGTPLHHALDARNQLSGSYLGFDYRIEDDRSELLFRICAAAFRQRNFAPDGIANRYMGAGYAAKLLEQFHPERAVEVREMLERADDVTRGISLETAKFLEEAVDLALGGHDRETIVRGTADLGMRVAAADAIWHAELDDLYRDMTAFNTRRPRRALPIPPKLQKLARSMMLGASIGMGAGLTLACGGSEDSGQATVDGDVGGSESIGDSFAVDPAPSDTGFDAHHDADAGTDVDALDGDADAQDSGVDSFVVDPPPPDTGIADTDISASIAPETREKPSDDVNDLFHWTDSSPKRAERSDDLPLHDPPAARLFATRVGDLVHVDVRGLREPASTRWDAAGHVDGEGTSVKWKPESPNDLLRVVVRTKGGVAILELRAKAIDGVHNSLV